MLLLRSLCVLLAVLLVPTSIVAQVTFNQIALTGESAPGVDGSDFFDFSGCLLYTSPSPRDATLSRMPSSA